MPKGSQNGVQRKRKSSQKCPIKVPPMPQNLESSHTPHLACSIRRFIPTTSSCNCWIGDGGSRCWFSKANRCVECVQNSRWFTCRPFKGRLCCEAPSFISVLFQEDLTQSKENVTSGQFLLRLRKAQNTLRNKHEDANFCFATKQYMKDTASLFGAENVLFYLLTIKRKCQ